MPEPKRKAGDQKGGWRTFVAAGGAGAIDCCFTMPMDTMSTQMQLQGYKTPMQCTRAILDAKGVAGLYAGLSPKVARALGSGALQFSVLETVKDGVDAMLGVSRS